MSESVLVCGGAGYIGSHMVQKLLEDGRHVVVLDNLSTGHREALSSVELIEADLLDREALSSLFKRFSFECVFHFCAKSIVGESSCDPYSYYRNNVEGTLRLLETMRSHDVSNIIFSSTAAIFGLPTTDFIDETHSRVPINPYGRSKLMVEDILQDASSAYGLSSVCLRYFNAAGALPELGLGEAHACETHLIPNILLSALGKVSTLQVFGDDYPTIDGTCVRDYVHVEDLADAHSLALDYLRINRGAHAFNLGNGNGFSVLEVIKAAEEVVGRPIAHRITDRRKGDPHTLVASSRKAHTELAWRPKWTELHAIVDSAWRWHRSPAF